LDGPLIVQRKHFIDEIASLDEAFDLLEAWRTNNADTPTTPR